MKMSVHGLIYKHKTLITVSKIKLVTKFDIGQSFRTCAPVILISENNKNQHI